MFSFLLLSCPRFGIRLVFFFHTVFIWAVKCPIKMFINVSFLEPHWINTSKCLVLSVFTSDFDHFTIPAVFH